MTPSWCAWYPFAEQTRPGDRAARGWLKQPAAGTASIAGACPCGLFVFARPRSIGAVVYATPYDELNSVLQELAERVESALGEALVGVYLQGSFAVGGFDEHSDCDFIAVTERELTAGEVAALQEVHAKVYDIECEWAKHLEGSYFPRDVLRSCDRAGARLWYLDHGARSLIRDAHCNTVVVRWVLRERGVALIGPDPATLVDPVPREILRQDISDTMRGWGAEILEDPDRFRNRFYQGFIVLSYCRMLRDRQDGTIGSKRDGAEWAKSNLDERWYDLIDRTWECRPDPAWQVRQPPDKSDFARTLEFVRYSLAILAEMETL